MHYDRNGRYGLLQEGSPGREPCSRSFNRAFVLRSELFAERNHWFDRVTSSAPINKPSHSDSFIICPAVSWDVAFIYSFRLVTQPSSVFQSRLHSTPRSSDLETSRPKCVFSSLFLSRNSTVARLRVTRVSLGFIRGSKIMSKYILA